MKTIKVKSKAEQDEIESFLRAKQVIKSGEAWASIGQPDETLNCYFSLVQYRLIFALRCLLEELHDNGVALEQPLLKRLKEIFGDDDDDDCEPDPEIAHCMSAFSDLLREDGFPFEGFLPANQYPKGMQSRAKNAAA